MLRDHRVELSHHLFVRHAFTAIERVDPGLNERIKVRIAFCRTADRLRHEIPAADPATHRNTIHQRQGFGIDIGRYGKSICHELNIGRLANRLNSTAHLTRAPADPFVGRQPLQRDGTARVEATRGDADLGA